MGWEAGGSGDTPALLSGLECGGETKLQLNSRNKEAGAAWQKMQSPGPTQSLLKSIAAFFSFLNFQQPVKHGWVRNQDASM